MSGKHYGYGKKIDYPKPCEFLNYKYATELARISYITMEQHALKNLSICLNTNNYSYLETSGGQSSNLYLNVNFFNTNVN
jgi:hypothetical protein